KKKYQPPPLQTPQNLDRDATTPQLNPQSFADLQWFQVFGDQRLQELVREALVSNYDYRSAVARIDQARAHLGILPSNQFPTIAASADASFTGRSREGSLSIPEPLPKSRNFGSVLLNLFTFELDIWGKNRKATEAARADLEATEDDRRTVLTTIVSD